MIDKFESYIPSRWLEDGLVVVFRARKMRKATKVVSRPGTLRIALSTAALAIGMSTVSVAAEPAGVSNFRALELSVAARKDEHVVPPRYWEELIAAMRGTRRLPAQTTKSDPPTAF